MSLLWKTAVEQSDAPEVPDTVEHYRSGGIGHRAGDKKDYSVVGMVPVSTLLRFREHSGRQNPGMAKDESGLDHDQRTIKKVHDDIKSGAGIKEPLVMEYDHEKQWGWLGEGNHRLAAAHEAGISHVPVRVYGRSYENGRSKRGVGAPLSLTTDFNAQQNMHPSEPRYIPPAIHPHHFEGLKP